MKSVTQPVPLVCTSCRGLLTALVEISAEPQQASWICPVCEARQRTWFAGLLRWVSIRWSTQLKQVS